MCSWYLGLGICQLLMNVVPWHECWSAGISSSSPSRPFPIPCRCRLCSRCRHRNDGDVPVGMRKWPCASGPPGQARCTITWISKAGQDDFVVIAVQIHPEVGDSVLGVQCLAGFAGQCEDHGAVKSACRIRHLGALLGALWRQGAQTRLSTTVLLGCDWIDVYPDHIAFTGVEIVRVAGPLNQVLHGVPMVAGVQDGFHVKVVRWHDLPDFRGSLDISFLQTAGKFWGD